MDSLAPIPTPPAQRWREFRIQALPVMTFLGVLACVVIMWREYVMPANVVGEVEAVRATVISAVPATLKELKVTRFQRVRAGQEVAILSTMDTETLQASLRMIEADLKLMRARMDLDLKRNEQGYEMARLDWMKERVDLAIERVNAQLYESEVGRQKQLLLDNTNRLVALTDYEWWVRLAASTRTNVIEREKYLAEKERTLPKLAPGTLTDEAILEDIKAQEEQLRATSQTISLKAPIDGMVSSIDHFPGGKIVPNLPIVTISATNAVRIVGYVRKPFGVLPKANDTVQIRRQTFKREVAQGTIVEVSGQLEVIPSTLVPTPTGTTGELGLPFAVSIPAELALIPGEPVDLILNQK
jgi:multidrug resistance efflux pump